ncbi:MAG: PilZ domain-containing protein, partial [Gammaproteobacteria bacterium]|nr:PilZ domain-containing protein [Gammaproteobacteria bacterium]
MRNFFRHPSAIPIDFHLEELVTEGNEHLKNVSFGGLSFSSKRKLTTGAIISIKIPLIQ